MKHTSKNPGRKISRRTAVGSAFTGLLIPAGVSGSSTNRASGSEALFRQEGSSGYAQAVTTTHHQATQAGGNASYLRVYGKGGRGEACPRCGYELERLIVGGRGTTVCELCQPRKV